MENRNISQINSSDRERIEFIKQKTEEAKAKLLKLAEKHNITRK